LGTYQKWRKTKSKILKLQDEERIKERKSLHEVVKHDGATYGGISMAV
jgi:hypothetical protein